MTRELWVQSVVSTVQENQSVPRSFLILISLLEAKSGLGDPVCIFLGKLYHLCVLGPYSEPVSQKPPGQLICSPEDTLQFSLFDSLCFDFVVVVPSFSPRYKSKVCVVQKTQKTFSKMMESKINFIITHDSITQIQTLLNILVYSLPLFLFILILKYMCLSIKFRSNSL